MQTKVKQRAKSYILILIFICRVSMPSITKHSSGPVLARPLTKSSFGHFWPSEKRFADASGSGGFPRWNCLFSLWRRGTCRHRTRPCVLDRRGALLERSIHEHRVGHVAVASPLDGARRTSILFVCGNCPGAGDSPRYIEHNSNSDSERSVCHHDHSDHLPLHLRLRVCPWERHALCTGALVYLKECAVCVTLVAGQERVIAVQQPHEPALVPIHHEDVRDKWGKARQ
mmetsp:Transcript_27134/g.33267  ORF Transcript_27134/g.33267 Transcript_27134/m.33267 type:complete len:228 (+) Transcript_27134:253-936(+)